MNKRILITLSCLTIIGGVLRFYKLDWGQGFFFHPDERNIASAVLSLNPAEGDFNPNFFAYGSFPIYVTYAIGAILSFLTKTNWLEFGKVILIGRGISAALSTLLIPLVYLTTKKLQNFGGRNCSLFIVHCSLLSALLTAFTPGLIQYAHFSTFEIILTFEYLLTLYFALKIIQRCRWHDYIFCAVIIGVSIATKVTSLFLMPILPLAWVIGRRGQKGQIRRVFISLLVITLTAFVLSPYNILDFSSFRGAMDYEGGVATGSLPVFYTAQFTGTTPIWYQLTQVFPYILGWPLTIIGFIALFFFIRHLNNLRNLFLLVIPALYFVFHAALFVKWMRYMIPMLPFLIVMAVLFLKSFRNYALHKTKVFVYALTFAVVLWTVIQGLSFLSIYFRPDTRVAAAKWASKNIPRDAKILSEVWDMGIITFNPHFKNIELFNFYELDRGINTDNIRIITENPKIDELVGLLEKSEYIIVPSQRIYGTRLKLSKQFPYGARYYQSLFDGTLGFTKIAEFDSGAIFNPSGLKFLTRRVGTTAPEETFKVFDHPKVMIFEKVNSMTQTQYLYLLR